MPSVAITVYVIGLLLFITSLNVYNDYRTDDEIITCNETSVLRRKQFLVAPIETLWSMDETRRPPRLFHLSTSRFGRVSTIMLTPHAASRLTAVSTKRPVSCKYIGRGTQCYHQSEPLIVLSLIAVLLLLLLLYFTRSPLPIHEPDTAYSINKINKGGSKQIMYPECMWSK